MNIPALAREIADQVRSGILKASDVTEYYLDKTEKLNPAINAFITIDREGALDRAREIDSMVERGEDPGPLAGVPVGIKDNIATHALRTTCGSRMLEDWVPPYDAHVVRRLRQSGAVIMGKLNMDEFAMGGSGETSFFGPTRNPHSLEHVPGGSSSGSAAAVAAGMVPLALGTDTGGSIRQPAAYTGITGMKPTYGRVSRFGLVAFASSLDQIGPMALDAQDAALLLSVIAGHDDYDSTSIRDSALIYPIDIKEKLRIGIARNMLDSIEHSGVRASMDRAISFFEEHDYEIHDITLPHSEYGVAVYHILATSEASSNLARYDGIKYGHRAKDFSDLQDMYLRTRDEGFGMEVKRRIMLGTYALSAGYYDAYYTRAQKVRTLIRQDFAQAFEKVDVIIAPMTPTPAFRLGELADDPISMYLMDSFAVQANMAGLPALSVPAGYDGSLPVGLQILAPQMKDEYALRVAMDFQEAGQWHHRVPVEVLP